MYPSFIAPATALMRRCTRGLSRRLSSWFTNPHLCMAHPGQAESVADLPEGYTLLSSEISATDWAQLLDAGGELGPWDEHRLRTETALLVPGTQVFLAHAGQLVACAGVYERDPSSWEIGWIAVRPDHRRCGLGEAVTRLAVARAGELSPRTVLLFTQEHHLGAIRLYLRLGFRPLMRHRSHRRRWLGLARDLPRELATHFVSSLKVK